MVSEKQAASSCAVQQARLGSCAGNELSVVEFWRGCCSDVIGRTKYNFFFPLDLDLFCVKARNFFLFLVFE